MFLTYLAPSSEHLSVHGSLGLGCHGLSCMTECVMRINYLPTTDSSQLVKST